MIFLASARFFSGTENADVISLLRLLKPDKNPLVRIAQYAGYFSLFFNPSLGY